MEINDFVQQVEDYAIEKGWRKKGEPRDLAPMLMNICSEIGEAWEEIRERKPKLYGVYPDGTITEDIKEIKKYNLKPEGVIAELIDILIWTVDTVKEQEGNVEELLLLKHNYNKTRSYRHGNKKY